MNIKKEIENYLETEGLEGVLLVTGKWGCGKTFRIKQAMHDWYCEYRYAPVLVSLFGVNTVEDLHRKVRRCIAETTIYGPDAEGKETRKRLTGIKGMLSNVAEAAKDIHPIAGGINAVLSLEPGDFVQVEKRIELRRNGADEERTLVLIFDDFERCTINAGDLMGAINEYSEGRGIKTILVANEEKAEEKAGYAEYKEKLISRTIRLDTDYSEIIDAILAGYVETSEGYRDFLKRSSHLLKLLFAESETENFRIFKSMIANFERVYDVWKKSDVPTEAMNQVLYTFGAMTFTDKARKNEETSLRHTTDKYSKYGEIAPLMSLRTWIENGVWDQDDLVCDLQARFSVRELTMDQHFLRGDFWELEQEYITQGLPIAVERAYAGDLSVDEMVSLLDKVTGLQECAISLPCEIDYELLNAGWDQRETKLMNNEIREPKRRRFRTVEFHKQLGAAEQRLNERMELLETRIDAWEIRRRFIDLMYEIGNITIHDLHDRKMVAFDDELLETFCSRYVQASNSMKREMVFVLNNLNFCDAYTSELAEMEHTILNLEKLRQYFENIKVSMSKTSPAIDRVIVQKSIETVSEKISKIQKSLT